MPLSSPGTDTPLGHGKATRWSWTLSACAMKPCWMAPGTCTATNCASSSAYVALLMMSCRLKRPTLIRRRSPNPIQKSTRIRWRRPTGICFRISSAKKSSRRESGTGKDRQAIDCKWEENQPRHLLMLRPIGLALRGRGWFSLLHFPYRCSPLGIIPELLQIRVIEALLGRADSDVFAVGSNDLEIDHDRPAVPVGHPGNR